MAAGALAACAFFFDAGEALRVGEPGRHRHALDACALCAKPLPRDSDIFMYRGDTPFCSEECRYEQMYLDAARAREAAGARRKQQAQRGRHGGATAAAAAAAASVPTKANVSVAS